MANHSETWGERALTQLFGSEVRARVIACVCTQTDEPILGRRLARALGSSRTAVSRELSRLAQIGLLRIGEEMGRAKPYYANEDCPLLPGLRTMVQYAVGAVPLLRDQLAGVDGIDAAFVYGSIAAGDDRPGSDVDIMVVGDIDGRVLGSLLREVERATRRQVNEVHYSREEFARRAGEEAGFLSRVLNGPKVFVKGDEDGLRELAQ